MACAFGECKIKLQAFDDMFLTVGCMPKYACHITLGMVNIMKTINGLETVGEVHGLTVQLENLFIVKTHDRLLDEMMDELAMCIEDALPGGDWHASCEKLLSVIVARRHGKLKLPLDNDVVKQLRKLQSGSPLELQRVSTELQGHSSSGYMQEMTKMISWLPRCLLLGAEGLSRNQSAFV